MKDLEKTELMSINGGHDGCSHSAGVAVGRAIRNGISEAVDTIGEAWDAFWGGVAEGLASPVK